MPASPDSVGSRPASKHVFISYSRHDTAFTERLEHDLNARGFVTWRDTSSIVGGEEWYKAIVRGIHDAYVMVQVVTPASDLSKWVLREALYADQKGLPIIPLLPVNHPIPFHLIATQPILCKDYAEGLARLVAALQTARHSAPAATTPTPTLGPTDRETELAYLDFVLSEMKGDLRSARYVSLGATRENTVFRKPYPASGLDEFDLTFDRFEPLVKAECLHGDDLDRAGEPVEDAREPLRTLPRVLLLGEPGSGKTTTLQQLAVDLAREAKDDPAQPLPVFVPLRSYTGGEPFAEFVRKQLGPLQSQYERLLAEGRLVLLCDALNEMARSGNGRGLVDEVRGYLRERQPWVVSCRVRDYQEELKDLPDVGKVRLKPLDLPRIKDVIDRRFHDQPERATALWADLEGSDDLLQAWQAFVDADKAEVFWQSEWPDSIRGKYEDSWRAWWTMHRDRRRMMHLCRNPFMLFMVCGTFERLDQLPPNRGALFATFVDNLLRREEANSRVTGRDWIEAALIRRALAQLAYAMQKSETGTEITRAEADRLLTTQPDIPDPALLLRLAASASLLEVGDGVRFTHQLLQEYFASEVMGAALDEKRPPTEFWPAANWWERQGWEETATILAGVRGDPEGVARWIAPAQPEVAYHALTECGIDLDLEQLAPETRAALVESAQAKIKEANPVGRAAAYRVLGQVKADRRSGIGLRPDGLPDIVWSEVIAAGAFQMGGDPEVPDYGGNWGGALFNLKYPFWVARYPVTYAQYEAFVAAGGYQEQKYWTKAGLAWKKEKTQPEYGWQDPQWHIANHPVIGVTWYESYAFTQWLDDLRQRGQLALPPGAPENYVPRLPTEAEWEKAARYPDGRKFPWGNEPDVSKLNSYESGIRRTSAAGIFPSGASPTGVYDLSGNVWEWCLSEGNEKYHFPEKNDSEGDAARVLRGGSWGNNLGYARCAYRYWYFPDGRYLSWGFRVVCSAPRP